MCWGRWGRQGGSRDIELPVLGRFTLSARVPDPPQGTLNLFTWEKHEGGTLGASSWPGQCLLGPPSTCLLGVLRCGRDGQTALHGSRPQLWAGSLLQV